MQLTRTAQRRPRQQRSIVQPVSFTSGHLGEASDRGIKIIDGPLQYLTEDATEFERVILAGREGPCPLVQSTNAVATAVPEGSDRVKLRGCSFRHRCLQGRIIAARAQNREKDDR